MLNRQLDWMVSIEARVEVNGKNHIAYSAIPFVHDSFCVFVTVSYERLASFGSLTNSVNWLFRRTLVTHYYSIIIMVSNRQFARCVCIGSWLYLEAQSAAGTIKNAHFPAKFCLCRLLMELIGTSLGYEWIRNCLTQRGEQLTIQYLFSSSIRFH